MGVKNASLNYEHQFFLNGVLVSGVTNVAGGYSIEESPINIIGKGYTFPVRNGPLVGNFSITKYFLGEETFMNHIDDVPITGSINYGDKSFGFDEGYLSEYSFSAGIGAIPEAQASIVVYGDIGKGIDADQSLPHPEIQIPNQGSIELDVAGYTSNRVTNFNYNIRVNRTPIYKIGSTTPVQVKTQFPIVQQASFQIEINDYEVDKVRDYLLTPQQQDINFTFKNPINQNIIDVFTIKNARLLSQNVNAGSMDLLTLNLSYDGYINRKDRQYKPIVWTIENLAAEDGTEPDRIVIGDNGTLVDLKSSGNSFVIPPEYTYDTDPPLTAPSDIAFVKSDNTASDISIIEVDGNFALLNGDFGVPALSLDINHVPIMQNNPNLVNVVNIIKEKGIHKIIAYRLNNLPNTIIQFANSPTRTIRVTSSIEEETHPFFGIKVGSIIYISDIDIFAEVESLSITNAGGIGTNITFTEEVSANSNMAIHLIKI